MDDKIINFFKFLEEKKGTRTPFEFKLLNPAKFKLTKEDLNVVGNLDLRNTKITTLPDNLKIKGGLNLKYLDITELPNNLKIDGSIDLSYTGITTLPKDLEVSKYIFVGKDKLQYFSKKIPSI